jgi:hypothetical protein
MKIRSLRHWSVVVAVLVLIATLSAACVAAPPLSSDFDEAQVKAEAQRVVELINAQDSTGLRAMCTVQMQQGLTDQVLSQMYAFVGQAGAYEGIEGISVAGATDRQSQEEFAVNTVRAKYQNRIITYTISFTKQMKLAGLYYK